MMNAHLLGSFTFTDISRHGSLLSGIGPPRSIVALRVVNFLTHTSPSTSSSAADGTKRLKLSGINSPSLSAIETAPASLALL